MIFLTFLFLTNNVITLEKSHVGTIIFMNTIFFLIETEKHLTNTLNMNLHISEKILNTLRILENEMQCAYKVLFNMTIQISMYMHNTLVYLICTSILIFNT